MSDQAEGRRYLWGAKAIGEELGLGTRQAFYLLEQGALPGKKLGNKWVSEVDALHKAVAVDEATKAGN